MKVLVAHNRYVAAQPSGENTVVAAEIEALRNAGVDVVTYLRSSDEIAAMSPGERLTLPLSPVYAARAQRDLARILQAERPDVVHLHNPYPLISPWIIHTAHRFAIPTVQTVHNYRHECVAGVFFRDGAPCHDCHGLKLPTPALRHRCYRGSLAQTAVMASALALHRRTWMRVDRFVAPSPPVAEFLRSLGAQDRQIVVRPNPVADPGVPDRAGEGFLYAGRLSAEKGVDLLLRAWEAHPAGALGSLVIAGDGPMRPMVTEAAARRPDIVYRGRLDRDEVRSAIAAAAAVVVPSTCDDVLPTIALEAMASARSIVATDRGGLPWLVGGDGEEPAGWIAEATVAGLAAALANVSVSNARVGKAARRRFEQRFSERVLVAALLEIYGVVSGSS